MGHRQKGSDSPRSRRVLPVPPGVMTIDLAEALMAGVDVPTFAELLNRPVWMDEGACRGSDIRSFFRTWPEVAVEETKAICRDCGVQSECLSYALEHLSIVGVWGGTTERERQRMRSEGGVSPTGEMRSRRHS